ncbi:hypothetical protein Scep_029976 [Stephania cephalantha]|uniref:Uncharacterized protein n=1 Tax=Stephania cephalantha TaxID=152367 RepID=A0AAP0HI50_9MAGN
MAKSIVDNELHVEQSDRNHVLDKCNLIMMGLVFDEVTRRWAKKVPDKDMVGEGGGNNKGDSDDEDDLWGGGEPILILDNDNESEIESVKKEGFEQCQDADLGRDSNADGGNEPAQSSPNIYPTSNMGALIRHQLTDLLHLFFDELKDTMECRLARVEDFLRSMMQLPKQLECHFAFADGKQGHGKLAEKGQ